MTMPPVIEDLGDPGSWQDALRWVRFPVINFNPVDNAPAGRPDGDRLTGSVRSFHGLRNNPEARHDHA